MSQWIIRLAVGLVILVTTHGLANAQNVAILGGPIGGSPWNEDVREKLLGTGFFSNVDIYDIRSVTPTLSQLQQYCGVLVYSDADGYQDANLLGDNLADYVDAGGGVVVAVFAKASIPFGGRFAADDYWCLEPAEQAQFTQLTLGTVHEPASPLMSGVTSFDGGTSSYHGTGDPNANATRVADWSNGSPLVVRREDLATPRVDLNFFPVSNAEREDLWLQTTDGDLLMGNALLYVCSQVTAVEVGTWGRVKAIYSTHRGR